MSKRFSFYPILAYLVVCAVVIIVWFKDGLVIGGGDESLLFVNPKASYEYLSSLWLSHSTGMPALWFVSRIPLVYAIYKINVLFNIPGYLIQAGLFFALMFLGMISTYLLGLIFGEKNKNKEKFAFWAGLFYLLNPYSISQVWGRGLYAQFFSFSALPLLLLIYVTGLKQKKYNFLIIYAIASIAMSTAYGFTSFIVVNWFVIFAYEIYWILINSKESLKIKFGLKYLFFCILLWFLVQAWWILPYIFTSNIYTPFFSDSVDNVSSLIGISKNFKPLFLIRLMHETYYGIGKYYGDIYQLSIFKIISYLPVVFLIAGFIYLKKLVKKSDYKFVSFLFFSGLIVSLGANLPVGFIFVYFFKKLPILQMFRNPYEKFGLVLVLAYSFIAAIGIFKAKQRFNKLIFIILLILTFGILIWPFWTRKVYNVNNQKVGVNYPVYYNELEDRLKQDKYNTRVLMTPLWSGDGAFYKWGNNHFFGVDPMVYILNTKQDIVSSNANFAYFGELSRLILANIQGRDLSNIFRLLRIGYLVNRGDSEYITQIEQNHADYLVNGIQKPNDELTELQSVCENIYDDGGEDKLAWIQCELNEDKADFGGLNYLQLVIRVDQDAYLDLALRDKNKNRMRWYGSDLNPKYLMKSGEKEKIILAFGDANEPNSQINLDKIELLEIQTHLVGDYSQGAESVILDGAWKDRGVLIAAQTMFEDIGSSGPLAIYKFNSDIAPEIGILSEIKPVTKVEGLMESGLGKLNETGYLVLSQNSEKDYADIANRSSIKGKLTKLSDTRYLINMDSQEPAYLILSKTYNNNWKIYNKDELRNNSDIFNKIKLLLSKSLFDDQHYVVNGYANLWKIEGVLEYELVFLPQVYADIGREISYLSINLILLYLGIYLLKNRSL